MSMPTPHAPARRRTALSRPRALTTLIAAAAILLAGIGVAAPAAAATNGTLTLQKQAVLDAGTPNPSISNVPGVPSSTFQYQIAYSCNVNSGYQCEDVVISDTIPAGLEIATALPSTWTVVGNQVTIPVGTIGAGAGTVAIPVRFVADPSLDAYDEVTVSNTATAEYAVGGEADDATSNTVDVTGVVAPIGGVTASKSVSPSTVQEFTNAPVSVTVGATNVGTTAGAITVEDVDADFFDAFALTSVAAPVLPAGAGTAVVETWDGTAWSPLSVPYSGALDVAGLRLVVDGVPAGAGATLQFGVALRDALRSGGEAAPGGTGTDYRNDVTASIAYADPALDDAATANATVRVANTFAGTPRVTKSVSPASVIVGQDDPVVFTLTSGWTTVGQGGLRSISITDTDPLGSADAFSYVDPTQLVVVAWPATVPAGAAQQVTVITNCGTSAPVAGSTPNTDVALPCAGSAITSVQFLFEPTAPGAVYASNATAGVRIHTEIEDAALSTPGSFQNDARIDVVSAPQADVAPNPDTLVGTGGVANTVNFSINEPQFQVTVAKNYAQPNSWVRSNVVLLPTRVIAVPSNATVDRLVVQDPTAPETDTASGTDFFDQYEITQLRSPSCPAGYALDIEVLTGATWSALTPPGLATNFCASSIAFPLNLVDDLGMTVAQQRAIEGIRFVYTNPGTGVSTVNVQPAFDIRWRDVNAETGAAQTLPARLGPSTDQVEPPIPSSGNCAAADIFVGAAQVGGDALTAAECPVLTQTAPPPSTGGGAGVQKSLVGPGANPAQQAVATEFADNVFVGTFALTQSGATADVEFLRVADPIDPANPSTGTLAMGYDAITSSQIFASITNIQRVTTTSGIPLNEKAVLEGWNTVTSTWDVLQTVRGTGTNNINAPLASHYGGWRITLSQDENNLAGDLAPGFVDPTHFGLGAPLLVRVNYQLRDAFRTTVSVHDAGDPVLYNLCYGINPAPLVMDPTTGLIANDADCQLPFGPPSMADDLDNYAGYVINDAVASIRGVPADDPTASPTTSGSYAGAPNSSRDLQILGSDVNALPAKSFRRDTAGSVCGPVTDESVAIPASGATPGAAQRRIACLDVRNESNGALDLELVDDSDAGNGDYWTLFQLTGVTVTAFTQANTVDTGYDVATAVRFDLATTGAPMTGLSVADVNALTPAQLASVTGVTVHAADLPGRDLLRVELASILRASVTAPAGVVNDFSVRYTKDGVNFETETAFAAIAARAARFGVEAGKTIGLASGSVNAVDTRPVLDVSVSATNSGDLGLDSMTVEDDDRIDPADYGSPTVPATLPTNTEDFWANVDFGSVTGIVFPAGTDEAVVQTLVGGSWITVGAFPVGASAADVQAAIANPAAVTGIRATFSATVAGGIPIDAIGSLSFTVSVRSTATVGAALTNTAEAGMTYEYDGDTVDEYQNPAQAAFTPQAGTLRVDVAKTTLTTTALSGDAVRWTLRFTNTGQQTIGLHAGTAPLAVADVLPPQLVFDPSIAAVNGAYPTPGGTSTFADSVLPPVAYDAGTNTLQWTFDAGEGLGAGETIAISITLRVASAVAASSTVTNTAGITTPSAGACASGDAYVNGRCTSTASITIASGGNVNGVKTIDTGDNASSDPSITCEPTGPVSYPCVGRVASGADYTWGLELENSGNLPLYTAVLIDRLPSSGDTTIVGSFARGTEWTPAARGPVTVAADGIDPSLLQVQYLPAGSPAACFAELTTGVTCVDWVTLAAGVDLPLTAIGVRVAAPYSESVPFQPGAAIRVSWSETAPTMLGSATDTRAANGTANPDGQLQQWNNFSFRVRYAPTSFFSIDSVKAGAQFDTVPLLVTKEVVEDGVLDPADYGSFDIEVTCTVAGAPVVQTVTVAHGETAEILGLPIGTACSLVELDAPDTVSWSVDEDAATEAAEITLASADGEPFAVTVTNTYASQSLTVSKAVIGDTTDTGYPVQVVCDFLGETIDLPVGQGSFTLVPGADVVVSGLPVGAECAVTETSAGSATTTDAELTVDGTATSEVGTTSVDVVIPDADGTLVRFTNRYLASLTVSKQVVGDAPVGATGFGIDVSCVWDGAAVELDPADAAFVLAHGGSRTIAGLPLGSACEVSEPDALGALSVTIDGVLLGAGESGVEVDVDATATQAAVVNNFGETALVVTKTVDNPLADDIEVGPFAITATCTVEGEAQPRVRVLDFTADGGTQSWTGLPAGTECEVVETATGFAQEITVADSDGTPDDGAVELGIGETQSVTITNRYLAAGLTIEKSVEGAADEQSWTFQVVCEWDGGIVEREVELADGATAGIDGLPSGSDCVVTEGETGADETRWSVDGDEVEPEDAGVAVTLDDDTLGVDGVVAVAAVNRYLAQLSITKTVSGPAEPGAVYEITLTPVDGDDEPIVVDIRGGETVVVEDLLAGARFEVVETGTGGANVVAYTGLDDGAIELEQGGNEIGVRNTFLVLQGTGQELGALPLIGGGIAAVGALLLLLVAWRRRRRTDA